MAERAESPSGSSRKQQVSRRAQKLSEERLARKRELDRQAQRSARVKTKNHIAHLESRIEVLTTVQGTGDVKGLIDQIEDQRKENEALKATLKTIGKLVGNTGENATVAESKAEVEEQKLPPSTSQDSPETEDVTDNSERRNSQQLDMGGPSSSNRMMLSNNGVEMSLAQSDLLPNTYSQALFPEGGTYGSQFFTSQMGHAKVGDFTFTIPSAESLLHAASLFGQSEWQANTSHCCCRSVLLSNELLVQCSKLQLQNSSNQKIRDADIPIRAVLHGWNAVTERYALDPVWQTLRHADNAMFSKCFSLAERLVCLRLVCLKLRHQVNPTQQNLDALPYFLHERPSQRCIQHAPLIDYLVWPGLRERFVFNPHCYCSEKFSTLFWPCFRFIWEYEFRDAYICNRQTGLYQFSAPFLERTRELQYFRMSPKFLAEFPELKADIPVAPQPDANSLGSEAGGENFDIVTSQGLDSLPSGFLGEDRFPQMDWSGSQANTRVGEV